MFTAIVKIIIRFWKWLKGKASKKNKDNKADNNVMLTHKEKKNKEREAKILNFCARLDGLIHWLSKFFVKATIIAILLKVVANYFWTELPEYIPTIYELFGLLLSFSEFLCKTALGFVYALFAGELGSFFGKTGDAIRLGWREIIAFLASIY